MTNELEVDREEELLLKAALRLNGNVLGLMLGLVLALMFFVAFNPVAAQSGANGAPATPSAGSAPKAADGHPDLSGVWWPGRDLQVRPLGAPSAPIGSIPRSTKVFTRSFIMSLRRRMKAEVAREAILDPGNFS